MINKVREKVQQFLVEMLDLKDKEEGVRVIGICNSNGGWVAEAEVVEKNRRLPGHHLFETKRYRVKLNADQEVDAFEQVENKEDQEEEE